MGNIINVFQTICYIESLYSPGLCFYRMLGGMKRIIEFGTLIPMIADWVNDVVCLPSQVCQPFSSKSIDTKYWPLFGIDT